MERRKLIMKKGSSTILTAHDGALSPAQRWGNKLVLLTNLDGWDNRNIEVSTEPKLFGNGSYVVKTRANEINITVDVVIFLDKDGSYIHTIKDNLQNAMDFAADNITLTREYYTSATSTIPYRTEGFSGGIVTSINSIERKMDEVALLSFNVLVPNATMNRVL